MYHSDHHPPYHVDQHQCTIVTTTHQTHNNQWWPPSAIPTIPTPPLRHHCLTSFWIAPEGVLVFVEFKHLNMEVNENIFLGNFGHQETKKIQQKPTNHFQFDGSPYVWAWVWCGWRWMKMCSWETLDRRLNSSLRGGGSSLRGSHGWGAQTR